MSQEHRFFGSIAETDRVVRKMCHTHLPKDFTLKDNVILLDESNASVDDFEKYYCYFLYCWDFLYKTYLAENFDQFDSLPVTQKMLVNNRISLDPILISTHPNVFLFHIVLAAEEYLTKNSSIYALGNDVIIFSLVGKIRSLMSSIDVISLRLFSNNSMTLSYIPYILNRGNIKISLEGMSTVVNSAEEKFKDIVSDPRWAEIDKFLKDGTLLASKKTEQDNLLITVESLNDTLSKTRSEFNFLNLSQAFTNIRKIKKSELNNINIAFYCIAVLLLFTPIALLLFNIYGNIDKFNDWNKLLYILPVATIEIILLYFMRLFYIQKNSLAAQLLQIDFRLSICEFIKNYVDDRTISEKDKDTWSAFEALIFSPIQLREDKIPSVLDGTDSLAEFISKVIKAKKTGSLD